MEKPSCSHAVYKLPHANTVLSQALVRSSKAAAGKAAIPTACSRRKPSELFFLVGSCVRWITWEGAPFAAAIS